MILQFPISDLRSIPNWMSFLREEAFFGPGKVDGFSSKLVVAFQPGMTLVAPFDGLLRRIVSVGEDPDSSPVVLEIQPSVYQRMLSLVDGFSGQLPRMRWYNVDRNAFESVLQTLIDSSEITATDPTQTVNKTDRFLSGEYSIFVEHGTIIASNLVSIEIEIRSREGIAVDPIVYYEQYLAQENPEDDPLDDRDWLTSLFPLLTRRSLVQLVNEHGDPLSELIRVQHPDGGIDVVNVSETEGMIVYMDFPTAQPARVLIESIEIPEPVPDSMEQTADRYLLVSRWPSGEIEPPGEIVINSTSQPTFTRFVVTHLRDWFASQYVTDPLVRLPRYSFGNHVEALVDGNIALSKMYEDIKGITNAQPPNGQFYYLMGWALTRLVSLKKGATDSAFNDLMKELLNKDAKVRIVLWDQLHLESDVLRDTMAWALLLIFLLSAGAAPSIPPLALVFFSVIAAGIAGYSIFSSSELVRDFLSRSFEGNEECTHELSAEGIPAFLDGKVRETRTTGASRLYDFIGSHHQKISVISGLTTTVAYCGGIDINGNRLDDPSHFVVHPYHDLHCRIIGPAAADIAVTMRQRWNDLHPDDPADDAHDGVLHTDPVSTGTHIVQVARTYPNKINLLSESYPYAPEGDFTIRDTLMQAIRQARTYIYLEDQYLTPPVDIKEALQAQLRRYPQLRLIMVIPRASDQPENSLRRAQFIGELLHEFDSDRVVTLFPTKVVFPHDSVRHGPVETKLISEITISDTEIPVEDPSSFEDQGIILVDEEEIKYGSRDLVQRKLIIGSGGRRGHNNTHKALHRQGTVVRQVKYRDIYVHPKTWIIDDIIATIGSANLNRRGMTHDSECNVFVMDGKTSRSGRSFAKSLRIELWAEHLGLHESAAARLMLDNPNEAIEFFISHPGPAGNRLRRYWAHYSELFPESWSGKLPNYWDVGLVENDMWDTYIDPDGTRPLE